MKPRGAIAPHLHSKGGTAHTIWALCTHRAHTVRALYEFFKMGLSKNFSGLAVQKSKLCALFSFAGDPIHQCHANAFRGMCLSMLCDLYDMHMSLGTEMIIGHGLGPSCCTVWALRAHCVHLPGNSAKITRNLSASTAKQKSPQDNNQHMRWHMGPRAIRGAANLAPNTKLGEVQQDANRFVKGGPIAPSKYCDSCRTHGMVYRMYTTEMSARSDSIAAQRQVLLHTRAELRGRDLQRAANDIFYAPRLAQSSVDVQWTTTNDISYSRVSQIKPKIRRQWAHGAGTVGAWVGQKVESPGRARAASGAPPRGQN